MEKYMSYIIIAGMVLVVLLIMLVEARRRKKELIKKLKESYGKVNNRKYDSQQFLCIPHYYLQHREGKFYIDDITWNDLDMDKIFIQLDNTQSSAGQEYLYAALRMPLMDKDKLDERERVIQYIDSHPEQRGNLQAEFYGMGFTRRISIFDYLNGFLNVPLRLGLVRYLPILLFASSIGLMIYHVSLGMLAFIAMLVVNVLLYFREKASIDSYFVCTAYISRLVNGAERIAATDIPELSGYLSALKTSADPIKSIIRRARFISDPRAVSGSLWDTVMEYINMIFHIDLLMFYTSLKLVKEHTADIENIIEICGNLETAIAIGSFRRTVPYICIPEFTSDNVRYIKATNVYHPGILEPVANCIDESKSVLLTGSNASGKSTFLKTIALNTILAQTIHCCMAKEMIIPISRVMSSMSLRDDLESGDSYYMVEIKSLKRIMDKASEKDEAPVMCFVDEVLRGTNTVERIAASSQILSQLNIIGSFVFAATHDIELTSILENEYSNYHFNEEVRDEDVYFSYVLHKGKATTRNAIKLLGIMGYDRKVIEAAEDRAQKFIQTGEWTV